MESFGKIEEVNMVRESIHELIFKTTICYIKCEKICKI